MAAYLSKINKQAKMAVSCLMIFFSGNGFVFAENLPDPTRPPATAADSGTQQGNSMPEAGPELQSVLISPKRKVAIISGQSVMLGEKFGEARVIKITENEVVLRNGQDVQVLKLFPGIQKKIRPGHMELAPTANNK